MTNSVGACRVHGNARNSSAPETLLSSVTRNDAARKERNVMRRFEGPILPAGTTKIAFEQNIGTSNRTRRGPIAQDKRAIVPVSTRVRITNQSWVGLLIYRQNGCYPVPDLLPSPKESSGIAKGHTPDYSGGTMPDLHRLPFYALTGTQNLYLGRVSHMAGLKSRKLQTYLKIAERLQKLVADEHKHIQETADRKATRKRRGKQSAA